MSSRTSLSRWIVSGLGVVILCGTTASSQTRSIPLSDFKAISADDIKPTGTSTQVVLFGDPNKPGPYAVQITFGPGKGSRPHYHDQDRFVTVIKGTWYVALGPESDTYDPAKMIPMKAGSFVYHPAFGHHYDGAKDEEAVVRIVGMGPVKSVNLEQPK
ncbi:MAG TPA: cupin domain-containing protein [Vicinamibacterales bacterium]|nr:cupin domain-containing protein [Vicinamibacterales bacterium]